MMCELPTCPSCHTPLDTVIAHSRGIRFDDFWVCGEGDCDRDVLAPDDVT